MVWVKFFKGNVICEGWKLLNLLYDENLVIYMVVDFFDFEVVVGFIKLYGLLI